MTQQVKNEIKLITFFRHLFKKTPDVQAGHIGIYHYVLSIDTINEDSHGIKCDIHAKVEAISVYEDLVEVKLKDIKIRGSVSKDISNLINESFPQYINPRYIKWELRPEIPT